MKKRTITTGVAIMLLAISTSCKKNECHECHYEKDGAEVEIGEKCGDELEAIEASGYNDNGTVYEVHCNEH